MRLLLLLFFIFPLRIASAQVEFSQTYYFPISLENNAHNYLLFYQDSVVYTKPYSGGLNYISNLGESKFLNQKQRFDNEDLIIFEDSSVLRIKRNANSIMEFKNGVNKKIDIPIYIDVTKRILRHDTVFFLGKNSKHIYYYNFNRFKKYVKINHEYSYNFIEYPEDKYIYRAQHNVVELAKFNTQDLNFSKHYVLPEFNKLIYFKNDTLLYLNKSNHYKLYFHGKIINVDIEKNSRDFYNYYLIKDSPTSYTLDNIINKGHYNIPIEEYVRNYFVDEKYKTAYFATTNMLAKSFLYINTIPNVFAQNTSKSCFTLAENHQGNILAGSYSKQLSIIKKDTIIPIDNNSLKYLVGQLSYKNHMYFIGERSPYNGIYRYDNSVFTPVKGSNINNLTGYYLFKSSQGKIYYGTSRKGLWEIDGDDLIKNNGNWKVIGSKYKVNVLTITEDNFGKILYGTPAGIGVYDPKDNNHKFYAIQNKMIEFGAMASVTDSYGTTWFGGMNGLYYLKSQNALPLPVDFKKLDHPFFGNNSIVTAFTLYDNYLIISNHDKMAVLDLKKFHDENNINIQYLTKHETNFKAIPEQNTLLTAKDKTIWFSTTDKIYHWDFKTWLDIPKYKIKNSISLTHDNESYILNPEENIRLSPKENGFDVVINYQARDMLPRYISYALQYEDDSIQWSKVDIKNRFNQNNLKAGNYTLHIKIFELNGETSYYKSNIKIPLFWYERWYFWVVVGTIIIGLTALFIYDFQKKRIKFHQIQFERASLAKEKEIVEKSLAQFQLSAINSQLRPHFLLNTFNTIGAHLKSNSFEEDLLDTLGNSVDILFAMTRENQSIHHLENEWELVKNMIKIYKHVYIKELESLLPQDEKLDNFKNILVPHGILHIPVENALIHGLNNKTKPPYILKISLHLTDDNLILKIYDNGIGLSKAKTLSNIRSNGTGLKNIYKIVAIFNKHNVNKILFNFNDKISEGTEVIIQIPLNYNYDISK
ncbi:hypothetical protein GO491_07160 [Flavobacteriaceae bacterium Ap0902]|nr:hypothetical protein [Flavobacteriaceae bacterium Ap0902]